MAPCRCYANPGSRPLDQRHWSCHSRQGHHCPQWNDVGTMASFAAGSVCGQRDGMVPTSFQPRTDPSSNSSTKNTASRFLGRLPQQRFERRSFAGARLEASNVIKAHRTSGSLSSSRNFEHFRRVVRQACFFFLIKGQVEVHTLYTNCICKNTPRVIY